MWKRTKVRIYVQGPEGVIGAREFDTTLPSGGTEKALVYHYDHLGLIESITQFGSTSVAYAADSDGKPGRFNADAWGQRRNPFTWSGAPATTGNNESDDGGADSLTPRGFTGHEMLDDLGLIHMNGRIYDPRLGRFLAADIVVQAPGVLQAYNRYSYVLNNPLTLTDPSGFFFTKWKEGVEDLKRFAANLFTSDAVKNRFGSGTEDGGFLDANAKAQAAQGVEKGLKTLEAAAEITTTAVKATPGVGQAVSLTQLVTGKNPFDVTGKTTDSRTEAASELIAGLVVGAIAGELAPSLTRASGKIVSAGKREVDTLFVSAPNKSGGRVWASTAEVTQDDFAGFVAKSEGRVTVLTGTHGTPRGGLVPERGFFEEDLNTWAGQTANVKLIDVSKLSARQMNLVLNRDGDIICGWCFSAKNSAVKTAVRGGF